MFESPVYMRLPTINEQPLFANKSCAEEVINAVVATQRQNWMRLHGFVVMPEALEIVFSPIKQGPAGVAAQIQAETIPPLMILLPDAGLIWEKRTSKIDLLSQRALDARMAMMLLVPVANGICEKAEDYPYSSANVRYLTSVSLYTGFKKAQPTENGLSEALNAGRDMPSPSAAVRPSSDALTMADNQTNVEAPEDKPAPDDENSEPS